MENVTHWTQKSTADFVYSISSDFVSQLETRMEEEHVKRSEMASRLGKTNGRVSQVFNDPGNISLRLAVEYAGVLGMKVGLIAYDDGDAKNNTGPINSDVFVQCWEKSNRPKDLFEVAESIPPNCQPTSYTGVKIEGAIYFNGFALFKPFKVEKTEAWTEVLVGSGEPLSLIADTQDQQIITGVPFVAGQAFNIERGVEYAFEKAIGK